MHPRFGRRVSTATVLAGAATLALAPSAGAADPAEAAPKKTTLGASGLRASWSAADGAVTVDPGKRFTVRVRAGKKAKRKARVRITATRAAGDAGPRRVVRRTLRKGTFRLRVAKTPGTRYRVVIRVGKRSRTVRITVAGPATPPAPKDTVVPTPAPACNPYAGFLGTPANAQAGFIAPLWVSNDSGGVLEHGVGVIWERQQGAGWATAEMPTNLAVPAVLYTSAPGVSPRPRFASVWSTLTAGTYRMALPVRCQSNGAQGVLYSAPVAVSAAPAAPLANDMAPLPLGDDMAPVPDA